MTFVCISAGPAYLHNYQFTVKQRLITKMNDWQKNWW